MKEMSSCKKRQILTTNKLDFSANFFRRSWARAQPGVTDGYEAHRSRHTHLERVMQVYNTRSLGYRLVTHGLMIRPLARGMG